MTAEGGGKEAPPPDELRRQAEVAVAAQPNRPEDPISHDTALALVHELQVHRIELALQNEELLRTRQEAEALRDQYIDLYEFAPVGYFTLDRDGTILAVNLTGSVLLSEDRQALVGTRLHRFMHPDHLGAFDEFCDRVLHSDTTETFEAAMTGVRGRQQWYALFKGRAEPGGPAGSNRIRVALSDITERKRADEALRESDAKYRNAVELSPDAILIHQDGLIVFANPAAAALVGAEGPDALAGRPILDLVHPGTRELAAANIELDLRGEESPVTAIEILRDDGTTVPAQGRGAAIPFGGRPAVQVILRDVTTARRVQQALRESEANMARAQSTAHLGNWAWDLATNVISCSDEHCRLYGLAPGDYPIEMFINLVHEDDRQSIRDALAATLDEGTSYDVECRVVRPDGAERILHGEGEAVRDRDGRVTGMFGIAQDITEQKKAEEALREYAEDLRRSNEDLERFAYVSSHDLQEPLRSIVSFSQLLERRYKGRLDADADEYIAFIVEGGNRMQTLILDLLAYSRVNSKAQELRPTDAEAVMAAVERHLDLQLREANATLTHDPLPVVTADPLQLEQVFENLVSNAVKFRRPDVPLRIHIGARRLDGSWEFSVSDNGIGIEPEYFDRIFVLFQRLHTRETYAGSGIGLPIVKRIVDRHGGTVRVESTPGEGSTFYFTLPDESSKNGGGEPPPDDRGPDRLTGDRPRPPSGGTPGRPLPEANTAAGSNDNAINPTMSMKPPYTRPSPP